MGNKESNSNNEGVPLDQFLASQQFRSNMQNVYSQNANIPAYPGAYLDNEHAEAYGKKDVPMTTKTAIAIKNDFTIDKNSVSLLPGKDNGIFYLSFKFSAITDVEISIFYCGKDIIDDNQNTQYIYVDTNKYPPIKSYIFGIVKDQEFPAYASVIDTRAYTKDDLSKVSNGNYPLIIKMETKTDRVDLPKKRLYTYFSFRLTGGKYEARFLKQKLEVNNVSYILDDIFGIAGSNLTSKDNEEGNDCPICLTNKIDTIVLPCKHMCLCLDCAKDLRDRNSSKCPMCRTTVENYLILKKS